MEGKMKKQILFFVGLLVSCTSNPILRDRNILRHDQEKLHQLFKELDVESSAQAHKQVHNIRVLLKDLGVATIDDARKEIKKLWKHKQKLRTLKDKIGGNNFKAVKQRVGGLNNYLEFEQAQSVADVYKKRKQIPKQLQELAQNVGVQAHSTDQVMHDLQLEVSALKHDYHQSQQELAHERAYKQQLHDRLEQVNQLLGG